MNVRIPIEIQPLMQKYLHLLASKDIRIHPVGVFLIGSIALGAFSPDTSDLDFITVMQEDEIDPVIDKLAEVHRELNRIDVFGRKMDGYWSDTGF